MKKEIKTEEKKIKQYAADEQTGKVFELKEERLGDIIAATISCLYLIAMLIFFCWQLFELIIGRNLLLKLVFSQYASSFNTSLFKLIAYTVIGGGIGGCVNGIRGFIVWHAERKSFGWRFVWKDITLPLLGFVLAAIVYAIVRSGMSALGGNFSSEENFTTQAMAAFGIGALSGYGSHKVFRWLDEQVNKLFKIARTPGIKVPDLMGKTQDEAEDILKESNLNIGEVNQVPTKDQTKIGKIIDQNPLVDSTIPKGASVDITIATKQE